MSKRVTNEEIEKHELLDRVQQQICRVFRNEAATKHESFTMHDFAKLTLRGVARNYGEASERDEPSVDLVVADAALRQAAVLYVYEALQACDIAIVKEWPEFDEMLQSLVYLAGDLPP